ncbi:hypothetical protein NV379_00820 [Paenibacillus sp. N1-5-1-14]|uniref:hypothetical protein n=1 Tax=Paenibacillus radicibacter TaxID=2972488 RepID=UPI0021597E80|nr:hypothetical protein [Paenibacillus radicibacter]MCR8641185.1 hypothetical protein [Paenibacillus radicibacter]
MKNNEHSESTTKPYTKGVVNALKQSFPIDNENEATSSLINGKQILDHMTGKKSLTKEEQDQLQQDNLARRNLNNL